MEINVTINEEYESRLDAAWLQAFAEKVLTLAGAGPDTEAGVVITGQEQIRELHREYMDEDTPTDVLSFPMLEGDSGDFVVAPDGLRHLGEVIISYPQAELQSQEHGHSTKREVAILLIHGMLHLLGYDHAEPDEEQKMRAREAELLEKVEGELP